MKVFGSFTRKCYQSLLNFLTKSITPIIDLYDNDYEYAKLYQKTEYLEKHSEGLLVI